MATQTQHYHLIKPESADRVAIGNINDNSDTIDGYLYKANERADQMADDYNASETYNTGDYVRRENYLYKCNTDNTTGTWDATKWDRVKVMEEITQGGGGGSSTLAGLNDVNISSPTDGQALVYDDTTGKWVNRAGGGGSSTFAGLNDVNVTGVQNGDIARYNSATGKWTDSSDLTDLELTVAQLQASVLSITDGHTILASDGTAMAQEKDLQFASGYVEDDDVNGKTIYIEMIRISQANYDTLKANGQLKPGAKYFIYDAQPVAVNAYNLPYSASQSTGQKIDEVNQSLLKCVTVQFDLPSAINAGQNAQVVLLSGYNIKTSNKTDIFSNKKLSEIFGNATEFLGLIFTWANGSVDVMSSCLIDKSTGEASVVTMHLGIASTLTAIRLVVFYK